MKTTIYIYACVVIENGPPKHQKTSKQRKSEKALRCMSQHICPLEDNIRLYK